MAALVQIIVTPGSGAGGAIAIAREVRKRLEREGYTAVLQAFRSLGQLIEWTKTLASNENRCDGWMR